MDQELPTAQDAPTINVTNGWLKVVVSLLLGFAGVELFLSRGYFLDDAFIHLRIAHHLLDYGRYDYNVGVHSFSTSSPLYTSILALASLISRGSSLPKVVGILMYLIVLALIVRALLTSINQHRIVLLLAALTVVVSPMGVRWLTDGMETGTVMLMAILLAGCTRRIGDRGAEAMYKIAAVALCALAVVLRVEFGYLLALSIAALGTRYVLFAEGNSLDRFRHASVASMPFFVGGLIGTAIIIALFGHLLPDTAVAKQLEPTFLSGTLRNIVAAHLGASFFGCGIFTLWWVSAIVAYRSSDSARRAVLLAANGGMLVFILLLIATRQSIQGIRYFVFIETYLTAFNILTLPNHPQPFQFWRRAQIAAVFVFLWVGFDCVIFARISNARTETYRRFSESDYHYLRGRNGLAYDIGFVGYFTHARILDACGLVNGRASSKQTVHQRLAGFTHEKISFLFVNRDQLNESKAFVDISGWKVVGSFDFPNFSGKPDTHQLIVEPSMLAAEGSQHTP